MSPSPAQCEQPHMSGGGISRKISDRFPADLPRVDMENDLQDWGSALGGSARHRIHPRSRGENCLAGDPYDLARDPSLLTQGKHIMRRGGPTCPGITPRWAGCHPHACRITIPRRTHPRSRREYPSTTVIAFESRGSSLLTRGTPGPREKQSQRERIIPAYAGNTPSDLCKHHTAQADYGSAVERLPLSYSFYRTPTTKEAQLESLVRHRYERPQAHQTLNQ